MREDLLVNIVAATISGEPRMEMIDNFWITEGNEAEIRCPPNGRLVEAKYPNGDQLKVEFREVASVDEFDRRFPMPKLRGRRGAQAQL